VPILTWAFLQGIGATAALPAKTYLVHPCKVALPQFRCERRLFNRCLLQVAGSSPSSQVTARGSTLRSTAFIIVHLGISHVQHKRIFQSSVGPVQQLPILLSTAFIKHFDWCKPGLDYNLCCCWAADSLLHNHHWMAVTKA